MNVYWFIRVLSPLYFNNLWIEIVFDSIINGKFNWFCIIFIKNQITNKFIYPLLWIFYCFLKNCVYLINRHFTHSLFTTIILWILFIPSFIKIGKQKMQVAFLIITVFNLNFYFFNKFFVIKVILYIFFFNSFFCC